jgi:hypothetical protein
MAGVFPKGRRRRFLAPIGDFLPRAPVKGLVMTAYSRDSPLFPNISFETAGMVLTLASALHPSSPKDLDDLKLAAFAQ